METAKNNTVTTPAEDSIQIMDILYLCLARWRWFVLSLVLSLGVAVIYILRTPPIYTRTATVLIKKDRRGKSASDIAGFSELGIFQSNININNELITFQSPALMSEVVKRLKLEMNYYRPGRFHRDVVYGRTLPATASLCELPEEMSAGFTLQIEPDQTVTLSDFVLNGQEFDDTASGRMLDSISTPMGKVVIAPTTNYKAGESYTLHVSRANQYGTVKNYLAHLVAALKDGQSSIIILTITDKSVQRAEEVLNTLIQVYNENWVKDKNQIAVSTSQFIDERLGIIEQELGNVDNDISSYKSEHLLPDVGAASSMYMAKSSQTDAEMTTLHNQVYMTRFIREYLADNRNNNELLPANSGTGNSSIESQISQYNQLLLERNSIVSNSSPQNPIVINMDEQLASLRDVMVRSLDSQIELLNGQIANLEKIEKKTTSQIAASPSQAKYLLSVERQQKVKEALYLFLLQKREENELSRAFTAYNTRIISPPDGSPAPTAPVRNKILLIGLLIGLMIPVGIIVLMETLNTRVRGRKDLENCTIPFIGEIPLHASRRHSGLQRFINIKEKDEKQGHKVVVKPGSRDIINEAFRVLRTNLEFMIEPGSRSNVIVVTSFNPGSGKSFITVNMAVSLAIKEKRVLVIDGDLRHGSSSAYVGSPSTGLSDYLSGRVDNLGKIIVTSQKFPHLHVLPVGTLPPNPTELLFSPRLKQIIESLRDQYDYVLIDCPPIELVADTQIIEKLADRTIFVVRAGLLERAMLPDLQNLYNEKKFKNMSLILNGTISSGSRYAYRYGYRYAYHYGYGGGYHYGSDKKEKEE